MLLAEKPRGRVSETRKITKSTMEKKRRARINTSLIELKSILGGIITHKGERFDKMEKADILEMTVQYVKQLQKNTDQGSTKDDEYKNGVNSCISEVINCIASNNMCNTEIKTKLMDHLADRVNGVQTNSLIPKENGATTNQETSQLYDSAEVDSDVNNNMQSTPDFNTHAISNGRVNAPVMEVKTNADTADVQYTNIQPTALTPQNIVQPTPIMPNMPLTILLPANFCSTSAGTTCVIPLTIPAASPQINQQYGTCSTMQYGTSPQIQYETKSSNVQYSTISPSQYTSCQVQYGTTFSPQTSTPVVYRLCSPLQRTEETNENTMNSHRYSNAIPSNRVFVVDSVANSTRIDTTTKRLEESSKAPTNSYPIAETQGEQCQLEINILDIKQKKSNDSLKMQSKLSGNHISQRNLWRPW